MKCIILEKLTTSSIWRTRPDGSWSIAPSFDTIVIFDPKGIDPFIRWSQILVRVRLKLTRPKDDGEVGNNKDLMLAKDFDRRGLDIWRTNLRFIQEACRIMDARLYVAKQATLIVPGLSSEQRRRCRYDFHGFDHDAHVVAFNSIYNVIDEIIPKSDIIDITPLSGQPECFYDHIHPTPKGGGKRNCIHNGNASPEGSRGKITI